MAHSNSHSHNHGDHGGHGGNDHHDHTDDIEPALQNLLYQQIEFQKITTLNESELNAGTKIVQKTWAQRLDPEPVLESNADEQLLITVPYVTLLPFPKHNTTITAVERNADVLRQYLLHHIDSPAP